ncbi:Hypothetical_protein [Hexamita inflata]|uniref:Hypothetical_protein n=1 Tax=Hexamita inflata TaxID=28002 RepID=A0AA86PMV5_9EUKA|nr:Hypothetical protein HINF_LOCUS1418 [Hexamita inflata]CAI9941137.1 Hypothetical protein HINF_LOCUS28782 [Hexamita inflata]
MYQPGSYNLRFQGSSGVVTVFCSKSFVDELSVAIPTFRCQRSTFNRGIQTSATDIALLHLMKLTYEAPWKYEWRSKNSLFYYTKQCLCVKMTFRNQNAIHMQQYQNLVNTKSYNITTQYLGQRYYSATI